MSGYSIQLSIFIGLTALVAALTWWRCRGAVRDANASKDYFLAGGTLAWPYIAGSLLLTNISAEQIVGMNGAQVALVAWWEFGAVAGLLILAHVLIPLYYKHGCTTTPELIERRLGDAGLRAMVSVLFLLGYLCILLPVVLYTGSLFMKSMFNPDMSLFQIAIGFAAVGLAYAAFGGLRAIAISDTFNGVGLLVLGGTVTVLALAAVDFDLSGIPAERLTLIGAPDSDIPWTTLLTGMVFIHVFYWGTNMVIAQRALAARSVREAQKGLYAAAAFKLVLPLIVVLPGLIAYKLYGDVGDSAYGRLVGDVLPPWLSGAFAAVIAGAVLSSYNSCLNSASALYACDLHIRYVNPKADVKRVGQWVAVLFTIGSLLIVPVYEHSRSIVDTLQRLNGLYSMPVLAIFIVAVAFPWVGGRAARVGLAFGALMYAVFTFVWSPLHYIHLMAITLATTLVVILLANRLLPRAAPAVADAPAR
ncbi:solute:sodium symporter family transporter [Arenimonas sp. MALMAid1274]|uniref:solute:sodium symporter family transporter n=1 Tax=Arenimonas sp. MALMAid1274 TaxID=3411630 RepID=UPI003BA0B297